MHFSFYIIADIRQCFSGYGKHLCRSDVQEVELGDSMIRIRVGGRKIYRGMGQDILHDSSINRETDLPGGTIQAGAGLYRRIRYNTQGFICQQLANTDAFLPVVGLAAIGQSVIRSDHAALGAVHEQGYSSHFRFNAAV